MAAREPDDVFGGAMRGDGRADPWRDDFAAAIGHDNIQYVREISGHGGLMKPRVDAVLIAGPTASGKSRAALQLAEAVGGTVINADSMQVYREAHILTARPSIEDMTRAPHALYGHVSAQEPYSVGRYQEDAAQVLALVRGMERVPIFTGGTDESISARYHARAVALVALERQACEPGRSPVTVRIENP